MTETTDRDLLRALNVQEALVASLIGKTRQAVNHGLREPVYFKPHELGALLAYCRGNMPASVKAIEEHISATRDAETAESIRSSYGLFLTEEDLMKSATVWLVAPDMRYFRSSHSQHLDWMVARAAHDIDSFAVIATSQVDAARFWEEFRASGVAGVSNVAIERATQVLPQANALPYCVFINPASNPTNCWVLGVGGFAQIDALRADGMLSFLRSPELTIADPTPAKPPAKVKRVGSRKG